MDNHFPVDDEQAQELAATEHPAEKLKDESNLAEAAQSFRRDSHAQTSQQSENRDLPVPDEAAEQTDPHESLPVAQAEDDDTTQLAAQQPEREDDAQQSDQADILRSQDVDDDVLEKLTALPVQDEDEPQRADPLAQLPSQDLEDQWRVEDERAALSAQPQRVDEIRNLRPQDAEDDWKAQDARAALRTEDNEAPEDADHFRDPSVSDLANRTLDERAEVADQLDRVDRFELHHAVEVYILRGIESAAARVFTGFSVNPWADRDRDSFSTEYNRGAKGFRQFVDDLYAEQEDKVELDKFVHQELHKALKEALAAEEIKVAGSAQQIMDQLRAQKVTEIQLLDTLENAYRNVFADHPGLLSDEQQAQTLRHIDEVREALRTFGPGRSRYR